MIKKDFCVILDPGHGCDTAGKRWTYGVETVHEYKINRSICKKVAICLTQSHTKNLVFKNEKDFTLRDRVLCANSYQKVMGYDCIYVSIHQNASRIPETGTGSEVFVAAKCSKKSKMLAMTYEAQHYKVFPKIRFRGIKASPRLYVLKHTHMPAILIEGLFMNHREDFNLLTDIGWRFDVSKCIADAIMGYRKTLQT